eukprot:TRINITY_DN5879_c0_g1_i2.p1 TRINITY_DN5879_c0_g1~~TRINITY_DN5879_c0_g1_i2.p1  ORF type:complete len:227 (-),score=42.57 TRINITY_DN5879_c0_g1_i2:27-707(-)
MCCGNGSEGCYKKDPPSSLSPAPYTSSTKQPASQGPLTHLKAVLLGAPSCGKTCISTRFLRNTFTEHTEATIGAAFCSRPIDVYAGRSVKIDLWDTAGQERYRSLAPMYYRNALLALLVYDITSSQSFKELKQWVEDLRKNGLPDVIMVLLGNKADMERRREVSTLEAEEYASELRRKHGSSVIHGECSAMTGDNVAELIKKGATEVVKNHDDASFQREQRDMQKL